jgi:CelD/BcsL family acetyltransferase involved in cellulose biosynthesis
VTALPEVTTVPTAPAPLTAPCVVEVVGDLRTGSPWWRAYERWAAGRSLPTTARAEWLLAGGDADDGTASWGVVAQSLDGQLQGMLVLLDEAMNGQTVTTLAGSDQGHRAFVTLESPEVAEQVAAVIVDELRGRLELTRVLFGPLDANDASVHALAAALPGAQLMTDAPIPVVRQDSDDVRDYLSHNMRRTLRKARNRLAADGRELSVHYTRDAAEIARLLPQIEECHRARDHVHGRPSDLDDARARRVWENRLRGLADRDRLELAVLRIDHEFAAHALGAVDGRVYRVLEGRFVTEWSRYAPGRLLEADVLQRVLDDPTMDTLDWMTAVAPEKLLATNASDPMVLIHWVPGL